MYENLLNGHVFSKDENVELKDNKDFAIYWDSNVICGYISAKTIVEIIRTTPDGYEKQNLLRMIKDGLKLSSAHNGTMCFSAYETKGKSLWYHLIDVGFVEDWYTIIQEYKIKTKIIENLIDKVNSKNEFFFVGKDIVYSQDTTFSVEDIKIAEKEFEKCNVALNIIEIIREGEI